MRAVDLRSRGWLCALSGRMSSGGILVAGLVASAMLSANAPALARRSPRVHRSRGATRSGGITHFLNAAYYGVPPAARDLENLRIAFAVLTTHWHQLGHGQLGARDAPHGDGEVTDLSRRWGRRLSLGPSGSLDFQGELRRARASDTDVDLAAALV